MDHRIFGSRFVDEIKRASEHFRRNSRLVAQNYSDEAASTIPTKTPTVPRFSQRLALSISASMPRSKAYPWDVTHAYIQSHTKLERPVYKRPPANSTSLKVPFFRSWDQCMGYKSLGYTGISHASITILKCVECTDPSVTLPSLCEHLHQVLMVLYCCRLTKNWDWERNDSSSNNSAHQRNSGISQGQCLVRSKFHSTAWTLLNRRAAK